MHTGDGQKLKVFISYSRDDLTFADQLYAALKATGFEPTLDRIGISGAANWRETLSSMILKADTVVFVLSPASAASTMCAEEVGIADGLAKRIIPVVCRPMTDANVPKRLQALNYIFFYPEEKAPGSGFGGGLVKLKAALEEDLGWMRDHTRLADRAAEWDTGGRAPERLLSGADIVKAEAWVAAKPERAPDPTALQRTYIDASAQAERERIALQVTRDAAARDGEMKRLRAEQEAERLRLEAGKLDAERATAIAESRRRRSQLWLAASVATLVIGGGSGWVWYDKTLTAKLAAEQANLVKDRELQLAKEKAAGAEKDKLIAEKDKRFALLQSEFDRNKQAVVDSGPTRTARAPVPPSDGVTRGAGGVVLGTSLPAPSIPTVEELQKRISKDAIDLMIAFEVGDRATYERRYTRPVWPGVQSGVVIGIGYDLGYVTAEQFERDWRSRLPQADIQRLQPAIGIKGQPAKDLADTLGDIAIPYDAALGEFTATTLASYAARMEAVFPNARELPGDSYGALVSLVFNRGPGLTGDNRLEMRNIRDLMEKRDFAAIPEQLRAMKRLWPTMIGLQKRRDAEATLFDKGLAQRAVEQASAGPSKL